MSDMTEQPAARPTNEELALRIKAGEIELMGDLWDNCVRLLEKLVWRELIGGKAERALSAGVTAEDLRQECYFALLKAVQAYDPAADFMFSSYLRFHVKNAVNKALGLKTSRVYDEPLNGASSLDAPISGDDKDDHTLGYFLEDPESAVPFEEVDHREYIEKLHADIEDGLAELTTRQEAVVRARYYGGQTLEQVAAAEGVSAERIRQDESAALGRLRKSKALEAYRREIIEKYSFRAGLKNFRNRGSAIERAVIRLDDLGKATVTRSSGSSEIRFSDLERLALQRSEWDEDPEEGHQHE